MRNNDRMVRTGVAIAFAIGLLPQMAAAAPDQPKAEACGRVDGITLTGKIRSLQSMREEPEAEVQTFFALDLPALFCGVMTVQASVMGLIPCLEGDTVTMTGEFSPPSEMFNMAFFRGQRAVTCSPGADLPKPEPSRH
jgi:hypothetical protein